LTLFSDCAIILLITNYVYIRLYYLIRGVVIMIFNSLHFLLFFPAAFAVFHLIPKKLRTIWLLLCSYYFYMSWNAKYALLIFFSTVVTYSCALCLDLVGKKESLSDKTKSICKKLCLGAGIVLNLGVLFFFKYFTLFFDTLISAVGLFGFTLSAPSWNFLLPVGISFYTFQAVGYTIDVYRGDIRAEKNFLRYALFVSFFPQLVAGPIERSSNLLGELKKIETSRIVVSWKRMRHGFLTMLWGFFLKVVVADRIAIFVDFVFSSVSPLAGSYIATAAVLFAFQIYCDFAGYSTIAVGASEMLGIGLMRNFETPYLSTSVREFWRRWHVSLSSWFRDYLYIPLGGSRKGTLRKYLNLIIVFGLSGLWHGAEWSFVVWGLLNGFYQIVEDLLIRLKAKITRKEKDPNKKMSVAGRVLHTLITFVLIDFAWIFFRAQNISQAIALIKSLIFNFQPWILFSGAIYWCHLSQKEFRIMLLSIAVLIVADILSYRGIKVSNIIEEQPIWFRWAVYIITILTIVIFGVWGTGYDAAGFIYFQF